MSRHILSSNPLVQSLRQVEKLLMEHLWGQSSRVGLPEGSENAGTSLFWSGGLGMGICAPQSCGFWAPVDLQLVLGQQDCS